MFAGVERKEAVGADTSAVGAINRPLRLARARCLPTNLFKILCSDSAWYEKYVY